MREAIVTVGLLFALGCIIILLQGCAFRGGGAQNAWEYQRLQNRAVMQQQLQMQHQQFINRTRPTTVIIY